MNLNNENMILKKSKRNYLETNIMPNWQKVKERKEDKDMAFFSSAVNALSLIVIAVGAVFAIMGAINLAEGYGSDNPSAKSQGGKQLGAGGGIIFIGLTVIPQLTSLF